MPSPPFPYDQRGRPSNEPSPLLWDQATGHRQISPWRSSSSQLTLLPFDTDDKGSELPSRSSSRSPSARLISAKGKEILSTGKEHSPDVKTDPSNGNEDSRTLSEKIILVLICCAAQFLNLASMNQTVAPVIILSQYFDIRDYGTLSWFSAAYSMSVGTFILPAGRLGDMYGHKRIFVIGWLWFGFWSMIAGFSYASKSIIVFSICRALQGIGPALLVPNAIAILARNFALGNPRNMAFACFGAAGPTGATTGAIFTALIAETSFWPWAFYMLASTCGLICIIALCLVPGPPGPVNDAPKRPAAQGHLTFDYYGALTGVSGLIVVNFALNQAPIVGWTIWYIPATLILGASLLSAFVTIELKFAKDPLVPVRGIGKDAVFALGCIAAGWGSHGIWAYFIYLFLEQVKGHTALLAAAMVSPVAITGVFFASSSVWLVRKFGPAWTMLLAMLNFFIGALLLGTVPMRQTYWLQIFLSVLIMPGAMNLSFPTATMMLSNSLPKEKQGMAASLVSTMVNYCIASGLGLAGTVHHHFYAKAAARHGIIADPAHAPPLSQRSEALSEARLESFRGPWTLSIGLSAAGVVIAAIFVYRTRKGGQNQSYRRRITIWFGKI